MPFFPRNFRATIKSDSAAKAEETISDTITVDASMSEDHVFKNTVTRVPLEDGSKISDHATIEPDQLDMIMLFTDTPVSNFNPAEQFESTAGRATELFLKMKEIRDKKLIVTVITGLIPHRSMMVEEVSVPRRSGDGRKVECRVIFIKVPRVTREGVAVSGEEIKVDPEVEHTSNNKISIGTIVSGVGIGASLVGLFNG